MNKTIRSTAVSFAVMVFFLMTAVGLFTGRQPSTSANRALLGAVITYFVISSVGKIIYSMIVNAIIDSKFKNSDNSGE